MKYERLHKFKGSFKDLQRKCKYFYVNKVLDQLVNLPADLIFKPRHEKTNVLVSDLV